MNYIIQILVIWPNFSSELSHIIFSCGIILSFLFLVVSKGNAVTSHPLTGHTLALLSHDDLGCSLSLSTPPCSALLCWVFQGLVLTVEGKVSPGDQDQ